MYQSDIQSTSVTHIQVPSSSKDEKNVPTSNLDTSSNQTKDAKNDSLERFRQFHQLRRENQTARLRQLQALEDQLTGAATNNQQRQRSLLNTRGDARLRTTSLIHDNRLPKLVLSERSSDDSDIRGPRVNKSHNSWRLSNVEELVEGAQIDGLEKRKTQDKSKRDSQSYLQASMTNQNETPNRTHNIDRIPGDSRKRNTLQDLERLIAESAQRLTESRKSIDELIQSHEIDTTKKFVDGKENASFDHDNIEIHEEEMSSAVPDHEKDVFMRAADQNTDLVQANNSGEIGLRQKQSIGSSSNGSSNLTHIQNRSLIKSKAALSSEDSVLKPSSVATPDMSTEFTSKEEKEKSLLQAPLEPSQNAMSSVSPVQAKLLDIDDNEQLLLSDDMQVTAIKQAGKPQAASPKLHKGDGRSSLRKPRSSKTNSSSSNIKDEMTNAWLSSSHNDVFGSDISDTSGRGATRQFSSYHDDATTISQRSNISRASTTSSSSAWTNSARSITAKKQSSPSRHQRMISLQDFSASEQRKASDSEEEALIRVAKPSRKSKTQQNEAQLSGSPNNPFRQSLKNSPSAEQLVRKKKVSIIQAPTEHSKVMESMHGSLAAKSAPGKSTSSAPGQRKRGKTLPGNLAERPTSETLNLPPMKVEPIDITLPLNSSRKNTVNSNFAKNLMDAPTRIPIAVMKPTIAKSSTSPEKRKLASDLRNKAPAVSSSALTSKTKSANNQSISGPPMSSDSLKTTSIPKTIRGGGQIPVARKHQIQSLVDSDDIQCTTSMSTPKSFSHPQKAAATVGSQSSRTDQQSMKELSKDALKYNTRSKIRTKSNTSNSDSSYVSKSSVSDGSKRLTHNSRRPSLTGTELVQDQMLREKDKATKLKADYVSAQGLITLPEDITTKGLESAASKRTKRRSMQTLSLHERLQNLVTEGKPAEHNQKHDWDTQSTGSSATDDSEIRALGHLSNFSGRARKAGQDRTSQLAKDRPLRLAMGPQAALKLYMSHLSPYEKAEILEFSQIYFVGPQSKKNNGTIEQTACNYGYDDERGDYRVINQDHLAYRYEILEIMGKGSFGQVLKCFDHRTGNILAIKIIRNKKRFHAQALVEVKILEKLMKWDLDDKHNNVRMTHHFYFRNHLCIAFECLSINLYEFIKSNDFKGFSLSLIRRFCIQLLNSLALLYQHKVVHCDLKPEVNVLLKHPAKSYIKVIDFGSSCMENEKVYTYIQSRFYRSPEVILGMTYNTAIDMWSLGCILAELFTGYPLFPGENEQDQLACIMEVQGVPDKYLVDKSTRKKLFFDSYSNPRIVPNSKGKKRRPGSKTLAQALKCTDDLFLDFVSRCLEWDAEKRLNPEQGLAHQWITGGDDKSSVKSSSAQPSLSAKSTLKI
ncbi:hypothetical protein INT43_008410 [Umbelopsis isabellina]|uniref:dual-specificity kinase n=1 Tax=Mortierella isabellina TaxID=91625 RepID=A0A8H7UCR9_MORIS|nr:hypothetical protein INT43_008410 [Umbelopsis isabellina]